MNRRRAVVALIAAGLGLGGPMTASSAPLFGAPLFGAVKPEPGLTFHYRGWDVRAVAAARIQRADKTVRAIKAQIDIIEQLHLSPPMMSFFRSQPIYADFTPGRELGRYSADRRVLLRVKRLDAKRPALLHALLLAYQDQRLPGGFANSDIARFRQQILGRHVWPNTAIMLQNNGEFFAVTASAYLYGEITREPYTRADLIKTQPDYYQWLARLFDGGRPRA
ncbi:MAG TPA: hypothetical protein VHY32_06405 [Caulobacteraceae bacterium]|jgi:hypothetical protein|nr:hypothetical protein [Caulobacteraceae bacterium]